MTLWFKEKLTCVVPHIFALGCLSKVEGCQRKVFTSVNPVCLGWLTLAELDKFAIWSKSSQIVHCIQLGEMFRAGQSEEERTFFADLVATHALSEDVGVPLPLDHAASPFAHSLHERHMVRLCAASAHLEEWRLTAVGVSCLRIAWELHSPTPALAVRRGVPTKDLSLMRF